MIKDVVFYICAIAGALFLGANLVGLALNGWVNKLQRKLEKIKALEEEQGN